MDNHFNAAIFFDNDSDNIDEPGKGVSSVCNDKMMTCIKINETENIQLAVKTIQADLDCRYLVLVVVEHLIEQKHISIRNF